MRTFKCLFSVFALLVIVGAPVLAHTVYVVPPSGGDDTDILQAALNECTVPYPEGCLVQLSAGTYKTAQLLVSNFHGTLKGIGMDATVIEALPELPVNSDNPYYLNPQAADNPYPILMTFVGGDITISDLFIKFTAEKATGDWYAPSIMEPFNVLAAAVWVTGASANASVNRVKMEGGVAQTWNDYSGWENNWSGLAFQRLIPVPGYWDWQWLSGRLSVTASVFKRMCLAIETFGLRDSSVMIGGSTKGGNTFEDEQTAVLFVNSDNTTFDISYNTMSRMNYVGLELWQGYYFYCPTTASKFAVTHNRVSTAPSYYEGWLTDAIWPWDTDPACVAPQFLVSDNTIHLESGTGGIFPALNRGSVFSNNRFSGSSLAGIYTWACTKCMIQGNNFQQYSAEETPYGTLAPIFLDEFTSWCTVVGGSNKTDVVDLGTNNTLVGVNNMHGNAPGPALKEAMQRKLEILKQMSLLP